MFVYVCIKLHHMITKDDESRTATVTWNKSASIVYM